MAYQSFVLEIVCCAQVPYLKTTPPTHGVSNFLRLLVEIQPLTGW